MSPARSKRTPVPHKRSRGEIVRAVLVAVGIALVTAIVVWLMRPGPSGTVGTGGLTNRQPRSSGLVFGTLLVGGFVTWYVLKVSKRARGHEKIVLPIALGVVLVGAVVVGTVWPDGLLRHDQAPPKQVTPETTPTSLPTGASGGSGATGASGASGASGGSGATGPSGATTTAPITTPTTGTPTTAGP